MFSEEGSVPCRPQQGKQLRLMMTCQGTLGDTHRLVVDVGHWTISYAEAKKCHTMEK